MKSKIVVMIGDDYQLDDIFDDDVDIELMSQNY